MLEISNSALGIFNIYIKKKYFFKFYLASFCCVMEYILYSVRWSSDSHGQTACKAYFLSSFPDSLCTNE